MILPELNLPEELNSIHSIQWQKLIEHLQAKNHLQSFQNIDNSFYSQLANVFLGSDYLFDYCLIHPERILETTKPGHFQKCFSKASLEIFQNRIKEATSIQELKYELRAMRYRAMLHIVWRDLNQLASLAETVGELSSLADNILALTLQWLYKKACAQYGTPIGKLSKTPQDLIIIAMGKYGAHELNLSSDIDLVFAFGEDGVTDHPAHPIANQEFFTRLGQQLINCLEERTVDGFVFRVDMRLRPFGQSGSLVTNLEAMEQYYQEQGRDWERYAMIKARVVCCHHDHYRKHLEALLRAFTYRRYIDFNAILALREMKQLIHREAKRRNYSENIKLGQGGIREIEFIVQSFQLIYGGRERQLQQPNLEKALTSLAALNLLPEKTITELLEAYEFLRNLEHRLQALQDEQTQTLPQHALMQARIAFTMGYATWNAFLEQLNQYRKIVQHHFARLIEKTKESSEFTIDIDPTWIEIWQATISEEKILTYLLEAGYSSPKDSLTHLKRLTQTSNGSTEISRKRLNQVMPLALQLAANTANPEETLHRILPLFEKILRRSTYFVLFSENPKALQKYIKFCSLSSWFANYIANHPNLLDEMLNDKPLIKVPTKVELEQGLQQQLLCIPEDDLEQQMELVRQFKQTHVLRVAIGEITEQLPLMKASDYLTHLAEALLEQVLNLVWHQLTQKYGVPTVENDQSNHLSFMIIGYGKLGGIELGFDSDLDLVFLYNAPLHASTNGVKSISNSEFFTKLAQRMIHFISTQTHSGGLYEIDLRLRPSGNSGLLVSTIESFKDYQEKTAWTWEHQALIRARIIAGDLKLQPAFAKIRHAILTKARHPESLKQEIISMREKMYQSIVTKSTSISADQMLKHEHGGIIDIEFIVQYLVLKWAHQYPSLTKHTDNIRILEILAKQKLLPIKTAKDLIDIYRYYRLELHRLNLGLHSDAAVLSSLQQKKILIENYWQQIVVDAK